MAPGHCNIDTPVPRTSFPIAIEPGYGRLNFGQWNTFRLHCYQSSAWAVSRRYARKSRGGSGLARRWRPLPWVAVDLPAIRAALCDHDHSKRLQALVALRHHSTADAEPILLTALKSDTFIIRSFACMGLGRKRTEAGFHALLERARQDKDPNVRAEAASALSWFGFDRCTSLLLQLFSQDDHWLVRHSILAALSECGDPDVQLQVVRQGLAGNDDTVRCCALELLGVLVGSPLEKEAETLLLAASHNDNPWIRRTAARTIGNFPGETARQRCLELRQDPDYRIVAASMESSLKLESGPEPDGAVDQGKG